MSKKDTSLLFETKYTAASPITLQTFLKTTAQISGRSLRQYFFKGLVQVNHRKAHSEAIIKNGDLVQVYNQAEKVDSLRAEALPIDIVYEDQQILVLNKPALLPVHPSGTITGGTLANRVAHYFEKNGLKLKVRPVNRLDHGTSGLIIFAKNASVQEKISLAIQQHQIKRIYYALVEGIPSTDEGIINQPIALIRGIRRVAPSGQSAETHYRIVERFAENALLELSLQTGRTHQIRVHLQHLGTPILGDLRYGTKSASIKRPALHAGKLQFDPTLFALPDLIVPLPDDMQDVIASLRQE